MNEALKKSQAMLNKEFQNIEKMQLFSRYLALQEKILESLDIEEINILSECYRVFGITSIRYNIEDLVTNYHCKFM